MIEEESDQSSSSSSSSSTSSEEEVKKAPSKAQISDLNKRKSYLARGSRSSKRMQLIEEASSSRESSMNMEQSLTRRN